MANPRIEVEIGAKIDEFKKKFNQVDKQLDDTGKQFGKLNEFAKGALQGIAAAFTVGAVVNFGKAVLDTTAKFQKFEAVLKTTLGSQSEANQALQNIKEFATTTPFQVDEVTGAFVKLANQGFKPTISQLRSLGDLAASTGKSFDQLAEAIIDAQVGEFERLKEFGIRASKQGDQVTFAFKGVETQVKNTSQAIQDYIIGLGQAEGVSGSMVGISGTLGGKLSELSDNIEQLRLAIGNQTSGVFATSIEWLNEFVRLATLSAKSVAQIREEASQSKIGAVIQANREQVLKLADAYQKINPDLTRQGALAKAIADVSRSFREAAEGGEAFRNQNYTFAELNEIIEGFISLSKELLNVSSSSKKTAQTFEEFSKVWNEYNLVTQTAAFANDRLQESFLGLNSKIEEVSKSILGLGNGFKEFNIKFNFEGDTPQQDNKPQEVPFFDNLLFQLNKGIPAVEQRLTDFAFNVNDILQNAVAGAFIDLGYTIGEALAQGGNVIKAIGQSLIKSIGRFLGQLGEQLILFGTAGLAFGKLSLALTNPLTAIKSAPLAIIAGLALTAAAGAIGSIGQRGIGGSSVGTSGVGAGTSFTGSGIGFAFEPSRQITGELVARGQDLVYIFNEANNRINKG